MAPPAEYLDETGQPLGPHIQDALRVLLPRLRNAFPALTDDTIVTTILENAGRRIADAERRLGPLDSLHGYAWVTVRSVATSYVRRASTQGTLELAESTSILAATPASSWGTAESIEREILLRELMARLTPKEQQLVVWKTAGFSSQEIGEWLDVPATAVDMQYSRVRKRIRELVSGEASASMRRGR